LAKLAITVPAAQTRNHDFAIGSLASHPQLAQLPD
jgi:hypothetical protein